MGRPDKSGDERPQQADAIVRHLREFMGEIEMVGSELLHEVSDRLQGELVLGHYHGARKHLYRTAADFRDDEWAARLAKGKSRRRTHADEIAARARLLLKHAEERLGMARPRQ